MTTQRTEEPDGTITTTFQYVDEWRHDPERRAEWQVELAKRAKAVTKAEYHLREAQALLHDQDLNVNPTGRHTGDVLFGRVRDATDRAVNVLTNHRGFLIDGPTDTYIGNCAAGGRPGE